MLYAANVSKLHLGNVNHKDTVETVLLGILNVRVQTYLVSMSLEVCNMVSKFHCPANEVFYQRIA